MNDHATKYFRVFRIHSITRPDMGVGLTQGFGNFTRDALVERDAESLGFYINEFLMRSRGDERHTEQFVLQAGNSLDGPWEDIKPIVPMPGDPDDLLDDEDDDHWGQCMCCNRNLTESEAALNDVCESCRPEYFERWQAEQDRIAEQAAESRWIM